jgi:hypothetical protein
MGRVLWHITMSLDGFIAGPGDDMAWLGDYLGPNPTADEVLAQIGALLIGQMRGGRDRDRTCDFCRVKTSPPPSSPCCCRLSRHDAAGRHTRPR